LTNEKADLIIHPVRLRILQVLADNHMTTSEIAHRLPDVLKSSIYRHLKKLLDGGLVAVDDVNIVKGTEEKIYHAAAPATLSADDIKHFTREDHLRYFSAYTATLIQGFKAYIESVENPDFVADRSGYSELKFYASTEELDGFLSSFQQDLLKLMNNPPQKGRRLRKLVMINHPEIEE
jgi:DNA-binding transcriptional ArsR family regulator